MKTIKLTDKNYINQTVDVLRKGGIVIFPSDTVYGLLCDAENPKAIQKLFVFKERPAGKPVSVFVRDFEMAKQYVYINEKTEKRLMTFIPGPYTIILNSKHKVESSLESENGTLGIRIPDYSPVRQLLEAFGKPLTATSANLSLRPPHYSVESFLKQTTNERLQLIDLIIDGGKLPHNKPSTVVDFTTDSLKILRVGDVSIKSKVNKIITSKSEKETRNIASTLLKKELTKKEKKPIVFILKGDLGTGKTVFVKGIGEALGITKIISPTFVVYYEYPVKKKSNMKILLHTDLYNVQKPEEFKHLGLEQYLVPGTVICIEWGEKAGEIVNVLKKQAKIITVSFEHESETERKLTISI